MLKIDFLVADKRWKATLKKERAFFRRLLKKTLSAAGVEKGDRAVSVLLTDDAAIQILNKTYRKKDKPTNVLSFPMEEDGILGDIVLAYETIRAESKAEKKTFRAHTAHLLVHGLLHLLGHDHRTDKEASVMEALEVAILKSVNLKNPY